MSLIWNNPWWLFLLPLSLLPLWRRQQALVVSSLYFTRSAPGNWKLWAARLHRPFCMLLLALALVLLAGPTLRSSSRTVMRVGVDLMLVLDISASMNATDIKPDRMSVARKAAADFILGRTDDRIGVILFAGAPFLLSPATGNRDLVAARLQKVAAEQRGTGTAIGDALAAACDRLKDSPADSRAVILLTDGRSNRGRITPATAGQAAAALGIRVYTIGFGTRAGAPLHFAASGPLPPGHPGGTRLSTLDEPLLRRIAEQTGGRFFRADDANALTRVYRQIDKLEKSPLEEQLLHRDRPLTPLLKPWLAALLLAELLIFRGWLRQMP